MRSGPQASVARLTPPALVAIVVVSLTAPALLAAEVPPAAQGGTVPVGE